MPLAPSLPRTVFIVDDDHLVARSITRTLTSLGYDVVGTAGDAETALAGIAALRPALAIIDIKLGGRNVGVELAAELLRRSDLVVVFLSGIDDPDMSPLAGSNGTIGFLSKPATGVALRTTVELARMQHEARVHLQDLERHYHALFEQAAVGVAVLDAVTGRVLDVNGRCAAIFAASVEDMIGEVFVERASHDQRPAFRDALARLGDGGVPQHVTELLCQRADGASTWIRITASPLRSDGPARHVVIIEDVAERRASEARERTAIAASRAKTDFLAHMSHELRTPLNAVLGLSEALLERIFGELSEAQANTLATIHSSGRHLLDLINDVLDIARVESGNLPVEEDQVPLRPLIEESTALVYGQLTAKGQKLVVDLAPQLPPVDVDRRRIKQVLLNLLHNANKFSPPGATVTMRAAVHDNGREVELSVSDDGPGIHAADHQRIFEPFVTLDRSMSRAHDGAGLGLALAKRIVELHHGRIRVDSEPGRGTTFAITLPCSAAYTGEAYFQEER
ncbi:MAG: response regulator [Deltaproteobacteria bacterium]|nr:response regulator [Deltaproteobacteria bacterium]MCW5808770.1 response regulator [Deltaproteobacteria bacterium]